MRQPTLKFASKPKRKRPEQRLQQTIVSYFHVGRKPRAMLLSIVNEGKRGFIDGSNLKKAGMRVGAPDLCFTIEGKTHFLEVKAAGGKQSPAQIVFEAECKQCGIPYIVTDNIDHAIRTMQAWGAVKVMR